MPILDYDAAPVKIVVADRILGDTIIKQVAQRESIFIGKDPFGAPLTIINVKVTMHASVNGEVGEQLTGEGFSSRIVTLVADNNTLVDAETGEILAVKSLMSYEAWEAVCALPGEMLRQGDYLDKKAKEGPVDIHQMEVYHIQAANQPPFSRFA